MRTEIFQDEVYVMRCLEQFVEDGFFILPSALDNATLEELRACCDRGVEAAQGRDEASDYASQTIPDRLTLRRRRYFIEGLHTEHRVLHDLLFGALFADITAKLFAGNAYLFVEQFVVKAPQCDVPFPWHQDSGYIPYSHPPYVSLWCALDAMTAENGALEIMPSARLPTPGLQVHRPTGNPSELVGFTGPEAGILIEVPAGSIVVFSSHLMHRSGPNASDRPRRAYMAQYSSQPILDERGDGLRCLAIPLVVDGEKRTFPFRGGGATIKAAVSDLDQCPTP